MELSRLKIKEFIEECNVFNYAVNEYLENLEIDKNDEKSLNIFFDKKDEVESLCIRLECIRVHLELNFDYDIYENTKTKSNYFAQNSHEGYLKKIIDLLTDLRTLKENMNGFFLMDLPKRRKKKETKVLSERETAKFFQLLIKLDLITIKKNNTEVSEAVNILTGFGIDNMRKNLSNVELNENEKINLKNFIREILHII